MALATPARSRPPIDYWPGFVDALSTLLLVIIFLLSLFMLSQFFLSQELSGRRRRWSGSTSRSPSCRAPRP
jgi:chemotaxis protein MotB